jgi:hypothetical protein
MTETETVGTTAGVTPSVAVDSGGRRPTIGRIVLYRLTDADADLIRQTRLPAGVPMGNPVAAGEQFPAVVVAAYGPYVNLQVLLDGVDSYWATSRAEGDGPGTWCWPPRV